MCSADHDELSRGKALDRGAQIPTPITADFLAHRYLPSDRLNRSERSDHTRGVEARQLDDGIGDTLVSHRAQNSDASSFVCFESRQEDRIE
jgi:hypothetical protein